MRRLEELPEEHRTALRELQDDADFYGVLVPLDAAATLKAVPRETAELFRSLALPSQLDAINDDTIDLVLDGILEVEHEGRFVAGADAFPLFLNVPDARETLSTEALKHAEELEARDVPTLTNALYSYNRLPRTRAWVTRFPDRDAVLAYLGTSPLLAQHWSLVSEEHSRGWI
ncbi:MAG TPA: hypothetical protein VGD79_11345, partial [Thermoanaerobaculia bacterium]